MAVVSAIIAAPDPEKASSRLKSLILNHPPFAIDSITNPSKSKDPKALIAEIPAVLAKVREKKPLCHNMTNLVVQNFAANVALAIGASPIMSNYGLEAEDLSK